MTELPHFAGDLGVSPTQVLASDRYHEILDLTANTRPSGLARLLEGPVSPDDLSVPTNHRGRLHDQKGIEELLLLHAQAPAQQNQAFSPYQPRSLAEWALQDQHLLSEGEDLTTSIIGRQTTNQGGKGREKQEDEVPDHAPRIVPPRNGVKRQKALSPGMHSLRRLVIGPHGVVRVVVARVGRALGPDPDGTDPGKQLVLLDTDGCRVQEGREVPSPAWE